MLFGMSTIVLKWPRSKSQYFSLSFKVDKSQSRVAYKIVAYKRKSVYLRSSSLPKCYGYHFWLWFFNEDSANVFFEFDV